MVSVTNSSCPMDLSGALDLSRSKPPQEPFDSSNLLPVRKFERDMDQLSPAHVDSSPRSSPQTTPTPPCTLAYQHREPCYESSDCTYTPENRSSFYSTDKDSSVSPYPRSSQSSPNYASCYPGPEQLSPYIIQAAFRQQLLIHDNKQPSRKSESDAISEAGSDGSHNSFPYPIVSSGRDGKVARPFKAYPKDPMSLAAGFSSVDSLLDSQSAEKYSAFRKRMLDQICAANGGQATVSNPKMRRTLNGNTNNNCYASEDGSTKGDDSYTERRKKNNAAAKKSRDRRRIKEDEIAIRAAFLERENIELKFELAALRKLLAAYGIPLPQI